MGPEELPGPTWSAGYCLVACTWLGKPAEQVGAAPALCAGRSGAKNPLRNARSATSAAATDFNYAGPGQRGPHGSVWGAAHVRSARRAGLTRASTATYGLYGRDDLKRVGSVGCGGGRSPGGLVAACGARRPCASRRPSGARPGPAPPSARTPCDSTCARGLETGNGQWGSCLGLGTLNAKCISDRRRGSRKMM